MAAKGMYLIIIPPTIQDGIKKVQLQQEVMEPENMKWQKAVILYVIGESPSIGAMERFKTSQWNFAAKPIVSYHNEGYFVILFSSIKDKNEVLYSGPHTMGAKPLILKSWSADFNLYNEVLKTIPLWASFPNLPLNCWGRLTLSRIASSLGCPIYVDECTANTAIISYARVLIEMDISKELPKCIIVQDPSGKEFEQVVEYDWVPQYCKKCLMVGHDCDGEQDRAGATRKILKGEQQQQRAEALRRVDSQLTNPWLIMGDFNAIMDIEDMVNGTTV
ncbi:uncharacterized protein LOC142165884 [Nicotiana tabacum]|uniref:Uncharacterized protein LOC142165884 n=1 Tax=Nicotiana tabacum TaxID=4097 RepID=A0AC58S5W1_TOBAC